MSERTTIDLEALRRDIDELRARVGAQIGDDDALYIKNVRLAARAARARVGVKNLPLPKRPRSPNHKQGAVLVLIERNHFRL